MPTAPATFSVPARRWRSWLPPWSCAISCVPRRTHSAPTPFGPSNLWAEIVTRSAPRSCTSSPSVGAAWTASTWNRIPRRARSRSAISRTGWIDADLVVGEHHRDERRPLVQGRLEPVRVHAAEAVDGDLHHLETELLQVAHGVPDGVVLHGARHEPVAVRLAGPRRALDRQVVRLRAAGGDHELAGRPTERDRQALVGLVERVAGDPAERVSRRGVPEQAAQVREHGLQGLGAQRRGRRMVQVDRHQGRIVRRDAREARWLSFRA